MVSNAITVAKMVTGEIEEETEAQNQGKDQAARPRGVGGAAAARRLRGALASRLMIRNMTLLVVCKVPSKPLQRYRRPLRFSEAGLVLAADTRFTWKPEERGPADDAQKLWPLGDGCFAGYTGDCEVAERAILSVHAACGQNDKWDDLPYTVAALSSYLRFWWSDARRTRQPDDTVILLGARDRRQAAPQSRYKLFRFASNNDFAPQRRDGLLVEGSGKACLTHEVVDAEIDHFTRTRAGRARDTSDPMPVRMIAVAAMVAGMIDRVIHKGNVPSVGGETQIMTLAAGGLHAPRGSLSSDAGASWRSVTRHDDFHSYTDMVSGGKFTAPLLDGDGSFRKGAILEVRTRPGSITGKPQPGARAPR